jgi:hypothetical protein
LRELPRTGRGRWLLLEMRHFSTVALLAVLAARTLGDVELLDVTA